MCNFTCVYVCKNGNLGRITTLDAKRMQYLMDNLPQTGDYKLLDLHRGNGDDQKYIVAKMKRQSAMFWVNFPRKSDYPIGDMVITFEKQEDKELEEIITDTISYTTPDYPME